MPKELENDNAEKALLLYMSAESCRYIIRGKRSSRHFVVLQKYYLKQAIRHIPDSHIKQIHDALQC